jgi:hypothetical protein
MNRNYDEIIAEMLIQLDKHSEELTRQSTEQTRQNLRAQEAHQLFVEEMKNIRHDFTEADTQLSAQLVHSATILDRIIKRNNLGL